MTHQERRAVLIFWAAVLLLTVGTFTAEAILRREVCVSAMIVEPPHTTIVYPEVCH